MERPLPNGPPGVNDFVLGDYKLTMWIPSELAGKVIGKKGTVIANLQRETRAKVINAMPTVTENSLWVAVAIIGDMKALNCAYHAISNLVDGEVDETVLEFTINFKKPFFLYGMNKALVTKRVSADTNVRIFIPEYNHKEFLASASKYHNLNSVATLEGSWENVEKCMALLDQEVVIYKELQDKKYLEKKEKDLAEGGKGPSPTKSPPAADSAPTFTAAAISKKGDEKWARQTQAAATDAASDAAAPTAPPLQAPLPPKVSQIVIMPTFLAGRLIFKGPKRPWVLNQIQDMTTTVISKVQPLLSDEQLAGGEELVHRPVMAPVAETTETTETTETAAETAPTLTTAVKKADVEKSAEKGRRRRRVDADSDADDNNDSDNSDNEDEEEEEAEEDEEEEEEDATAAPNADAEAEGEEEFFEAKAGPENEEASSEKKSERAPKDRRPPRVIDPNDIMQFRVSGYDMENVRVVVETLCKFVQGVQIKDLMTQLKKDAVPLSRVGARSPRGPKSRGGASKDGPGEKGGFKGKKNFSGTKSEKKGGAKKPYKERSGGPPSSQAK